MAQLGNKIPVILDTDIGSDIDDTWALTFMLKCPELDPKLVVTERGNTIYRAKIAAKMLESIGRTDIPVGIGLQLSDEKGSQDPWVEKYDLKDYPGIIYKNGVEALIKTIMKSSQPITLICIGPVSNIAAALYYEPRIAERSKYVGMQGCIRKSPFEYRGGEGVVRECNAARDPESLMRVFAANWEVTITPVDTCGFVRLKDEKYRIVRNCKDPSVQALLENYRIWLGNNRAEEFNNHSSILFDTVAVYLAFADRFLFMEKLGLSVTSDGRTIIDDSARTINCATEWKNLSAFEDFLVQRITCKFY